VIISENGASFPEPDTLAPGQLIDDVERIAYLKGHIEAVAAAQAAGVDVEEYTVWSLIDNFEWADGYTQRFGLAHVNMQTGERTPKASFEWLRRTIEEARA
jgi:beta-glucosidase